MLRVIFNAFISLILYVIFKLDNNYKIRSLQLNRAEEDHLHGAYNHQGLNSDRLP